MQFFTIEKSSDPRLPRFLILFGIARQHYVVARVAFAYGLADTASLLAQQCIEAFLKAMMLLHWESFKQREIWGHDILTLLSLASRVAPELDQIAENDNVKYFLGNLVEAYTSMRFGEAKSTVKAQQVIQVLDGLAFRLLKTCTEIITKSPLVEKNLLYVPDELRKDFLRGNMFFKETAITNNVLALYTPPGIPLPELPRQPPFTTEIQTMIWVSSCG